LVEIGFGEKEGAMNFLEQLAAEWYTLQGYFVRTNLKFGPRSAGGYKGEMDVAAFDPQKMILVHVETSGDAESWNEREKKFRRKFEDAAKHYSDLFHFNLSEIHRLAIVGYSSKGQKSSLGGDIEVISVPGFVALIAKDLRQRYPWNTVVPEIFPLLRAMQFALWYGQEKAKIPSNPESQSKP
jgi:hypothetical protein